MLTGEIAVGFMEHYASLMGDIDPETGRRYLPEGVTLTDIYTRYKIQAVDSEHLSFTYFCKLWNKKMKKNVSLQKSGVRMSCCTVCSQARKLLEHSLHPNIRADILRDRDEHLLRAQ